MRLLLYLKEKASKNIVSEALIIIGKIILKQFLMYQTQSYILHLLG